MNGEEYSKDQPIADEDLDTTAPNPASAAAAAPQKSWKMPEPVFRKTSGYLPQGFVKPTGEEDASPEIEKSAPSVSAATVPPVPAAPAIAPQPEISQQITLEEPAEEPVAAPKSGGGFRAVLMILGVLAMLIFLAAFLAVVYFLFLTPSAETNF